MEKTRKKINNKTAAIICANGVGDCLLMMIAAKNLKENGYCPIVYTNNYNLISPLFKNYIFKPIQSNQTLLEEIKTVDLVLVENDNSDLCWFLLKKRENNNLDNIIFLFPKKCKAKTKKDISFIEKLPFATNIVFALKKILKTDNIKKENDLITFKNKQYKKFKNRIIIHPTSKDKKRNWPAFKFIKLSKTLLKKNFNISFIIEKADKKDWEFAENFGIKVSTFETFIKLSEYIYESGFFIGNDSGIGHLASSLKIPTLTISGNPKRIKMWRPDFYYNNVVLPSIPLINFKGINFAIRDNYWQKFISTNTILKKFLLIYN